MCKRIFRFKLQLLAVIDKISISMKLPQISHICKNHNFSSIIATFYDMWGILFFIFASCEPLRQKTNSCTCLLTLTHTQHTVQPVSVRCATAHASVMCDIYDCAAGFFPGGTGGPPSNENFANPPNPTLVPVFGPRLVPPPQAEVRPRKFEKF